MKPYSLAPASTSASQILVAGSLGVLNQENNIFSVSPNLNEPENKKINSEKPEPRRLKSNRVASNSIINEILAQTIRPTPQAMAATTAFMPPATPCGNCGCPGFWTDLAEELHCLNCSPPSITAMARGVWQAVEGDYGPEWEWHDHVRQVGSAENDPGDGQVSIDDEENYLLPAGQIEIDFADLTPCATCKSYTSWTDLLGRVHCDKCNPPPLMKIKNWMEWRVRIFEAMARVERDWLRVEEQPI